MTSSPDAIGTASGVYNAMRQVGGACGIAIVSAPPSHPLRGLAVPSDSDLVRWSGGLGANARPGRGDSLD